MSEIDHDDARNIAVWIGKAPVGPQIEIGSNRARNFAAAHLALLAAVDNLIPGWSSQGLERRVRGANEWLAEFMTDVGPGPAATRFSDGTMLTITRSESPDELSSMPGLLAIARVMPDGRRIESLYEWSAQNLPKGEGVAAPANGPHPGGDGGSDGQD